MRPSGFVRSPADAGHAAAAAPEAVRKVRRERLFRVIGVSPVLSVPVMGKEARGDSSERVGDALSHRRLETVNRKLTHSGAADMLVGYVSDERYVALADVAVVIENDAGMFATRSLANGAV